MVEKYLKLANFLGTIYAKLYACNLRDELVDEALLGLAKALTDNIQEPKIITSKMRSRILNFLKREKRFTQVIKYSISQPEERNEYILQKLYLKEIEKRLLTQEKQVFNLLLQDFDLVEIAEMMKVSKQYICEIRLRLRKKINVLEGIKSNTSI